MDYCYAQLHIYDCPEDQRAAAHETIVKVFDDQAGEPELMLDEDYTCEDLGNSVTKLSDLAKVLAEAAPGASWSMWDEPADGTGVLHAYAPERGHFSAACDHGGDVTLTRQQIFAALDPLLRQATRGVREQFEQAIADATGLPWHV